MIHGLLIGMYYLFRIGAWPGGRIKVQAHNKMATSCRERFMLALSEVMEAKGISEE
jgi:hypothetical protein